MITIWKFPFEVTDSITLRMPRGAEILCVQMQQDTPCVWAKVDTNRELEDRRFVLHSTGHPMPEAVNRRYVGTFQPLIFVFHLFELVQVEVAQL